MKNVKKIVSIYGILLICVLAAVLIVGNCVASTYSNLISTVLGHETMEKIEVENADEIDTNYYPSNFGKQSELYAAEVDYAQRVQEEGSVLLQNKGLPIAKSGNITLLGSGCAKDAFLVCGGGSGSIDTAKTPTLKAVFEGEGYRVNDVMWNFYTDGAGKSTRGDSTVGEAPVSGYGDTQKNSFAAYNDAAIIVIGRLGAEDRDVAVSTTEDPSKSMLELSKNELDLIDLAVSNFDKVVVLLNTLNVIETGPLMEKDVSVLWIGAGGQQGLLALPDILNGNRNPSGRLVDTYAYDNFSSPAMVNFGDFDYENADKTFGSSKYLIYQEGIYVGYKYYETRYEDKVLGSAGTGDYDYAASVAYPFGYGLSYTKFSRSDYKVRETSDKFEVSVTVKNDGSLAGKDVVEIYLQKPYESNGRVENASVELAGFVKTDLLDAGASKTYTVEVPKEYLRSYDESANNGAGGYEIAPGDYYLSFGADAHAALNNILAMKGKTRSDGMTADGNAAFAWKRNYSADEAAKLTAAHNKGENGEEIENRLEDVDVRSVDPSFKYLSRSDWTNTWPSTNKKLSATPALVTAMSEYYPNIEGAEMPKTGQEKTLSLVDMKGLDYGYKAWDSLLDQLTIEDMRTLVCNGAYGTVGIQSINKDKVLDKDGPAGISATLIGGKGTFGFPVQTLIAATWNVELADEMGKLIGEDALLADVSGWYAPGLNMHRTPFSGRNFEYYSEDSLLSGIFGAHVTAAAQEMGLYTFSKHFALNDEELNRQRVCVFSNEQAAREIYLRPFELNVRDGKSRGIMVSMNRIGGAWTGAHKGLVTDVLRGEWGFTGCVVTDSSSIGNTQKGLYAGTDLWLGSGKGNFQDGWEKDAGVVTMLRNACHNILYTIANSNAMNGIAPGTQFLPIMPLWQVWLVILDIVVFALCLAGVGLIVYFGFVRPMLKKSSR